MDIKLNSFYPVICSRDVALSRAYYAKHFGFEVIFEADWYVGLRRPEPPNYELALLDSLMRLFQSVIEYRSRA